MSTFDSFKMPQHDQQLGMQPTVQSVPVTRVNNNDDIEVIDLDNTNRDVKPTTWHRTSQAVPAIMVGTFLPSQEK